jgi:hypothetical protein
VQGKREDVPLQNQREFKLQSVFMFIAAVVIGVALIAGGTGYSIYKSNMNADKAASARMTNQQEWCDTLRLLTKTPVIYPSDPATNPSRVFAYELYKDFLKLKTEFGC